MQFLVFWVRWEWQLPRYRSGAMPPPEFTAQRKFFVDVSLSFREENATSFFDVFMVSIWETGFYSSQSLELKHRLWKADQLRLLFLVVAEKKALKIRNNSKTTAKNKQQQVERKAEQDRGAAHFGMIQLEMCAACLGFWLGLNKWRKNEWYLCFVLFFVLDVARFWFCFGI